MSYANPAPTGVASQHLPQTKWPGYVQTCPRTSRLLQLHPNNSGTSRPPWITADHLQITSRSPRAVQELLKCLEMLKLENSRDSDANQVTQYRGLGLPSWLTPTPGYVVHVCYLTTPKAPPETPCRTTLIWIRRPEWMVHTRGWKTPNWTNPIRKNPETIRKLD